MRAIETRAAAATGRPTDLAAIRAAARRRRGLGDRDRRRRGRRARPRDRRPDRRARRPADRPPRPGDRARRARGSPPSAARPAAGALALLADDVDIADRPADDERRDPRRVGPARRPRARPEPRPMTTPLRRPDADRRPRPPRLRVGVDIGGSKVAVLVVDADDSVLRPASRARRVGRAGRGDRPDRRASIRDAVAEAGGDDGRRRGGRARRPGPRRHARAAT